MLHSNQLKELLNSRVYQNSKGKVFSTPESIFEKPLELLDSYVDDTNYRIRESVGSVNRNSDGTANIAYNKVIIEFKLNTYESTEDYSNICILYDLTGKEGIYKIATGKTVRACLNMCVWADKDLFIHTDYTKLQDKLKSYLDDLDRLEAEYAQFKETLINTKLDKNNTYKVLGKVLYNTNSNTLRTAIVGACDELVNSKSPYYIESDTTNLWNIYNSITQQFSNKFEKNYTDVPSNTLELSKIIYN